MVKSSKKPAGSNRAFYLIIAVIAIGGIAALTYASTRSKAIVSANPVDTTLPKVESHGYVMGNPAAPVEVTEFGDYECPACGRFSVISEPDVRKNYVQTGKVRWRFIDYPLSGHRNTWQASRAAACADEQGKFWEFHDLLYQTQDRWNGEATDNPDKVMKDYARGLGLNASQFDQCIDTKKTQAKVQAHLALAEQRKVMQTPTFIIGDQQLAGALPYDEMAKYINAALSKAGTTPAATGGDTARSTAVGGAAKKGQ